jgi:hypothetical protein
MDRIQPQDAENRSFVVPAHGSALRAAQGRAPAGTQASTTQEFPTTAGALPQSSEGSRCGAVGPGLRRGDDWVQFADRFLDIA